MKKLLLFFVLCLAFIPVKADVVIVTKDKVNVRAAASTTSRVLGKINCGASFNEFESVGDWFKINYIGKIAYISETVAALLESSPVTNQALRTGYETMFPLDEIRHSGYIEFLPADKGYIVLVQTYQRYSEQMGELPAEPQTYIGRVKDGKLIIEYYHGFGYPAVDNESGKCNIDDMLKEANKLDEPQVWEYDGKKHLFWNGEMLFQSGDVNGDISAFPGDADAVFDSDTELKKQENEKKSKENLTVVEVAPEYPGGVAALMRCIAANLRYPTIAAERNIQGRVILKLAVEADGSVSNVEVVKSVDSDLDREAVRVVKSIRKWKPGTINGKPVRAYFMLPVNFKLS